MIAMINANFTKQNDQAAQAGDPTDKDSKSDDFGALISGLCMTPGEMLTKPKETPVEPANTGPAANAGTTGSDPASGTAAKFSPDAGFLAAMKEIAAPLMQATQPVKTDPLISRTQDGSVTSTVAQQLGKIRDVRFLPPDGETKFAPPTDTKAVVKDLKTQMDKFAGVPEASPIAPIAPITVAKTLAVMAQEKAAVVKDLASSGTQAPQTVADDPSVCFAGDQLQANDAIHVETRHITDPAYFIDAVRERAPRKLTNLISDVTATAQSDDPGTLPVDAPAQGGTSIPPRVTALLDQVKPAVIQLAAAATDDGKQVLKMKLHPAELGTVEIRLEKNSAGVLEAHINTSTEAARHFLSQGLDTLRNALQTAGWQVGRMEISTGAFSSPNGGDSSAQNGERQETSSPGSNSKNFEPASTRSDEAAAPATGTPERLVNLQA
jgi:flagellar hook-length control protein FliK